MRIGEHRFAVMVEYALRAWVLITALAQHPAFDKLRGYDSAGMLIPDWRFFAPDPGERDVRLLYRLIDGQGTPGTWYSAADIADRVWHHMFWFPERREDKALFDASGQLRHVLEHDPLQAHQTAAYQLLRDRAEHRVQRFLDVTGARAFQFALVEEPGYDTEPTRLLYTSPQLLFTQPEPS